MVAIYLEVNVFFHGIRLTVLLFVPDLFLPQPFIVFRIFVACVCVFVCVCQSLACPHNNSAYSQTGITKLDSKEQNTLI